MTLFLALFLATAFPPNSQTSSQTSWMRPDAFRLTIGMDRLEAVRALRAGGMKVRSGKDPNQVFADYADDKALTLDFRDDRLVSVRFELFTMLPLIRKAFDQVRADLQKERGDPKKLSSKSIIVYDNALPNVIAVVSDNPTSENGKKWVGVLAVRYFDPRTK